MDVCHLCKSTIPNSYFRVGSEIACGECAAKVTEQEKRTKWKYFWRGILFGAPAAVVVCLVLWGVDEFSTLGGGGSILSGGAFLRGTAIILMATLLGAAISKGTRGRGSIAMQICSAALLYLAYVIGLALAVADSVYVGNLTFARVEGAILIAPILPFLALIKSPLAITGLIVLGIGISAVWRMTGASPALMVSGPFDDPGERKKAGMLGL
jgi:hypothetical protein